VADNDWAVTRAYTDTDKRYARYRHLLAQHGRLLHLPLAELDRLDVSMERRRLDIDDKELQHPFVPSARHWLGLDKPEPAPLPSHFIIEEPSQPLGTRTATGRALARR
jgi:hypothetical protein